jgi:hypothetical protein
MAHAATESMSSRDADYFAKWDDLKDFKNAKQVQSRRLPVEIWPIALALYAGVVASVLAVSFAMQ